jgi:4-hydroxy-L-threonine phosphate dehydrogenase PdxA
MLPWLWRKPRNFWGLNNVGVIAMVIAVIDGLGGGIGAEIVSRLRQELPLEVEIIALGTNAIATEKMMKAKANRGATGENAIRISIREADFIIAPLSIFIPHSMMGEVTPGIAEAVALAPGYKLVLPITQPGFEIMGLEWRPISKQISQAIQIIKEKAGLPLE